MSINLSALMKQRYDTAANWTAQNPTLLAGEIGIESDTKKWKVGTGATAWTSLVYAIGGTYPIVNADIAAAAAIVDTKLATIATAGKVSGTAVTSGNISTSGSFTSTSTVTGTNLIPTGSGVPTNGIYLPAANSVAVATNSTGRLFVSSAGLVGIGNSSPGADLDIASLSGASNAPGAIFRGGAGTGNSGGLALYNSSTDANQRNWYLVSNSTAYGDFAIKQGTSQGADPVLGTDMFYISRLGNVGIGTTSPTNALLHVSSSVSGASIKSEDTGGTGSFVRILGDASSQNLINWKTGTSLRFATSDDNFGSFSERFRCDTSGRLLVGTSSARSNFYNTTNTAQFQLEGTNFQNASASLTCNANNTFDTSVLVFARSNGASIGSNTLVTNNTYLGAVSFMGNDGTEFVKGAEITAEVDGTPGANDMPGRLVFSTTADGAASPTEAVRINSSGNLLVGVTSSAQDCRTHIYKTVASGDVARIQNASGNTGVAYVSFRYGTGSGTETGYISTDGTSTAYNTTSDYRLKENVVPLTGALDRLNQLAVHRFNFIADPGNTVDGFIAHEAQAVVPECVTGEKDAVDEDGNPVYQGIDQSKLVPLLTAALQEAIGRIETLEAEVSALKGA